MCSIREFFIVNVLKILPGITGPVKVDEVGNRVADFDLFDMKSPATKEFQV